MAAPAHIGSFACICQAGHKLSFPIPDRGSPAPHRLFWVHLPAPRRPPRACSRGFLTQTRKAIRNRLALVKVRAEAVESDADAAFGAASTSAKVLLLL